MAAQGLFSTTVPLQRRGGGAARPARRARGGARGVVPAAAGAAADRANRSGAGFAALPARARRGGLVVAMAGENGEGGDEEDYSPVGLVARGQTLLVRAVAAPALAARMVELVEAGVGEAEGAEGGEEAVTRGVVRQALVPIAANKAVDVALNAACLAGLHTLWTIAAGGGADAVGLPEAAMPLARTFLAAAQLNYGLNVLESGSATALALAALAQWSLAPAALLPRLRAVAAGAEAEAGVGGVGAEGKSVEAETAVPQLSVSDALFTLHARLSEAADLDAEAPLTSADSLGVLLALTDAGFDASEYEIEGGDAQRLARVFAKYDQDGNRVLDRDEWARLFHLELAGSANKAPGSNGTWSEALIAATLKACDEDGDGAISLRDFASFLFLRSPLPNRRSRPLQGA